MELSVCLIAKNEEKIIGRCLRSVKNIADEIIVVDTGSSDRTVDIAKRHGAKVIQHNWNNDFSEARNISIDNAQGKWILFIDCDEEIPKEEGEKIRNLISTDISHEAYYFKLVNFIGGNIVGSAIVLRLFKNKPEYRFKGRLHEQVAKTIETLGGKDSIKSVEIQIYHYGYDPNVKDINEKAKRNLNILNSVPEDERDGYYYYVLGNEYARVQNFKDALEIYFKGLDIAEKSNSNYIYVPYLVLNTIKSLNSVKRFKESLFYCDKFSKRYPTFRDLYFFEALAYMECLKYSSAKNSIEKYLSIKETNFEYPDNNLSASHNIPHILSQLNDMLIQHKEDLLSIIVFVNEQTSEVHNLVKTVNESACEILLLDLDSNNTNLYEAENLGGNIVKISSSEFMNAFDIGIKYSKGSWILLLNENEILSYASQKELLPILENTDANAVKMKIVNSKNGTLNNEIRIFKRNASLIRTMQGINVDSGEVLSINVLIHNMKLS